MSLICSNADLSSIFTVTGKKDRMLIGFAKDTFAIVLDNTIALKWSIQTGFHPEDTSRIVSFTFNPVAFFGKAKGAAKLIKESGKQVLGTMAVNFAQEVTAIEIKNRMLYLGIQTLENFIIRLQNINAQKVIDWYKTTMPSDIKRSLAAWSETYNARLLKLDNLISDKSMKDYFETKKEEALHAWQVCDKSFPSTTWCIH